MNWLYRGFLFPMGHMFEITSENTGVTEANSFNRDDSNENAATIFKGLTINDTKTLKHVRRCTTSYRKH